MSRYKGSHFRMSHLTRPKVEIANLRSKVIFSSAISCKFKVKFAGIPNYTKAVEASDISVASFDSLVCFGTFHIKAPVRNL